MLVVPAIGRVGRSDREHGAGKLIEERVTSTTPSDEFPSPLVGRASGGKQWRHGCDARHRCGRRTIQGGPPPWGGPPREGGADGGQNERPGGRRQSTGGRPAGPGAQYRAGRPLGSG